MTSSWRKHRLWLVDYLHSLLDWFKKNSCGRKKTSRSLKKISQLSDCTKRPCQKITIQGIKWSWRYCLYIIELSVGDSETLILSSSEGTVFYITQIKLRKTGLQWVITYEILRGNLHLEIGNTYLLTWRHCLTIWLGKPFLALNKGWSSFARGFSQMHLQMGEWVPADWLFIWQHLNGSLLCLWTLFEFRKTHKLMDPPLFPISIWEKWVYMYTFSLGGQRLMIVWGYLCLCDVFAKILENNNVSVYVKKIYCISFAFQIQSNRQSCSW